MSHSFEALADGMFNVSREERVLQVPHWRHFKDTYTAKKLKVQPTIS